MRPASLGKQLSGTHHRLGVGASKDVFPLSKSPFLHSPWFIDRIVLHVTPLPCRGDLSQAIHRPVNPKRTKKRNKTTDA